ncbi:hypothetical protein Q3G72_008914 [Acer saccharum]|nr:hypothetical protein Q3G72_008914 [Acer saccharum]
MPEDSRQLFIALAAFSWAEPVPEAFVEATWSVLGQKSLFPLIVCKLVEGSLLMKADTDPLYEVHDMVSLYLNSKINDSAEILLNESKAEETASICPWLLIFGKENIKEVSKRKIELSFSVLDEKQNIAFSTIISLEAILEALMASKSISELETSRAGFSSILGPRIADLISTDSQSLTAMSAEAITNIFIVQHHAIVTLKAFYEMAGPPPANGSLRPANLRLLPWQVRLRLETFVLSDRSVPLSPKPQTFEDVIHRVLDGGNKQVLEAMQDLIPFLEKADDPRIREMILKGPLIERLSELLQHVIPEQNSLRSGSSFLLTKLACAGGEPCIKKYLEYDIIPLLVKMMQCGVAELQDSAYTALHQMLFSNSGLLVLNKIFQMGLIERMVQSLESKTKKTREVNMHCVVDIVELGNKACLERMLSLQAVEKLLKLEKTSGGSGGTLTEFLKGMDKCKHLSIAKRKLMKQQVVRKVRVALKGHKFETKILAALDGLKSSSSSGSGKYRKIK